MADDPQAMDQVSEAVTQQRSPSSLDFYVAGIGASAGGLEALELFFDNMPDDSGVAFVIVQHLSPDFKSLMDQLLARHTTMPIHKVENGMPVEPNGIYLIPPNKTMILSYGKLLLSEKDPKGGLHLPIDIFFTSLAQDMGEKAIAVVLSGTGSDGSRGLEDIHSNGGLVLVQDTESAGFDGMPRSATATGMVDVVASADKIPRRILNYVRRPSAFIRGEVVKEDSETGEVGVIFRLFRHRYGIDFSYYRRLTVERRLERRLGLSRCRDMAEYLQKLEHEPAELDALYRDLLVEVTEFFRDPKAFVRLREDVVPEIVDKTPDHGKVRIWVAGCATGEEAYSMAILFDDYAKKNDRIVDFKVFATDVHQASLESASAGVYRAEAVSQVPDELREKYFVLRDELYHVSKDLRQMVIFAPHDLTKDPPFTKVNLLSCRNVLIYFDAEVQKRLLSLFHFGLNVGGTLVLGSSETVGDLEREFESVDRHWRIYRKLRDVRLRPVDAEPSPITRGIIHRSSMVSTATRPDGRWSASRIQDELLQMYVPPSILVNEFQELVRLFGEARRFLVQPTGEPTMNVLKMVEGDLRTAMSAALLRAKAKGEEVVFDGVTAHDGKSTVTLKLRVRPIRSGSEQMFLICLEDSDAPKPSESPPESFDIQDQSHERIHELQNELQYMKESLQATVEELETSNEELQSTNEELVASNEELQSTNEELHSVNEELYTVNTEHQEKIVELTQLTADMDNLLKSTEIGTIFLDQQLRIRKFTPRIADAFHILHQDIGRSIDQFAYHFDEDDDWIEELQGVLTTGKPREKQVVSRDGKAYLRRILPYHIGVDERQAGVVVTFTDVCKLVEAARKAERYATQLERSNQELQDFAYAVSHDFRAPLSHIYEYARIVQSVGAEDLPDEVQEALARLLSRTGRLQEMFDSLLQYSRVSTRGNPFETAECDALLEEVLQELDSEIQSTGATITRDRLPALSADRDQLSTVLWHLLDNAIKYCATPSPKIHIGSHRDGDHWVVSVRDNGIGILPRHLQDVFVVFKRLGFKEDVRGNGFGLALCKRIVERHNGKMWVESEPGKGSTFFMRMPCALN